MTNIADIAILETQEVLDAIKHQIANNEATLSYSLDTAYVEIDSSSITGLPKGSNLRAFFYSNSSYSTYNDPKSKTGEYLIWNFYDFELRYIEVELESGVIFLAEIDGNEDTFSETVMYLFDDACCTDYMAHENADLVSYYGATNPLYSDDTSDTPNSDVAKEDVQEDTPLASNSRIQSLAIDEQQVLVYKDWAMIVDSGEFFNLYNGVGLEQSGVSIGLIQEVIGNLSKAEDTVHSRLIPKFAFEYSRNSSEEDRYILDTLYSTGDGYYISLYCEHVGDDYGAIDALAKTNDVESIYFYLLESGQKYDVLRDVILNSGQAKWIRLYCENISDKDMDMVKALIATGDVEELLKYKEYCCK